VSIGVITLCNDGVIQAVTFAVSTTDDFAVNLYCYIMPRKEWRRLWTSVLVKGKTALCLCQLFWTTQYIFFSICCFLVLLQVFGFTVWNADSTWSRESISYKQYCPSNTAPERCRRKRSFIGVYTTPVVRLISAASNLNAHVVMIVDNAVHAGSFMLWLNDRQSTLLYIICIR